MPERSRDDVLLAVARSSIEHGWRCGAPVEVVPADYPASVVEVRASFVTLRRDGTLRGCIGSPEACRPLVADVAHNAFAAANRDPRFPPLRRDESAGVEIHISILGPPEPIRFADEDELLACVEPGVHGLWISAGARRATFLPQVWAQVPEPRDFLARLCEKAGIGPGIPCERLDASRYTVEVVEGPLA